MVDEEREGSTLVDEELVEWGTDWTIKEPGRLRLRMGVCFNGQRS